MKAKKAIFKIKIQPVHDFSYGEYFVHLYKNGKKVHYNQIGSMSCKKAEDCLVNFINFYYRKDK